MHSTTTEAPLVSVITSAQLLNHWQGHRGLTRKVIEAFPEKELFEFTIGGMRPFAAMVEELLAIAGPGLKQMTGGEVVPLSERIEAANSKAALLLLWDNASAEISNYWSQLPDKKFSETIRAFGQYEGTILSSILYFIDNEIHHRAQGYVYLRALGIEPPQFWNR